MSYEVEAFREDTDLLTEKLLALVVRETERFPPIDRSIIVAASLANVACRIDGNGLYDAGGVTGRLAGIADMWRGN